MNKRPKVRCGLTRRGFIAAGPTAIALTGAANANDVCGVYVEADAGPFYPVEEAPRIADLTMGANGARAAGQVLYVFGAVTDENCAAVAGADILIWQADSHGQYEHPQAEITVGLDPNFRYYAKLKTKEDGSYLFKTILPRWYAFRGLRRAAHIHFGVKRSGGREWLTEMYFAGDQHHDRRARDVVWKSRNAKERRNMIVALEQPEAFSDRKNDFETGALCCEYNLMIG